MATMSLDKEIMKYLPELDKEEKKSILGVIKAFLKSKDIAPGDTRVSIEEYNKEAHEAMARVASGQFYTHEEVEEMSKQW